MIERGVSSVRSPLGVLAELRPEEVQAAVDATRRLQTGSAGPSLAAREAASEAFVY